jgi:hypothetical protein
MSNQTPFSDHLLIIPQPRPTGLSPRTLDSKGTNISRNKIYVAVIIFTKFLELSRIRIEKPVCPW